MMTSCWMPYITLLLVALAGHHHGHPVQESASGHLTNHHYHNTSLRQ